MKLSPLSLIAFSFTVLLAAKNSTASNFKIENNLRNQTISIQSSFDAPTIKTMRDGKLHIEMESLMNTMEAGLPSVPVKTFKVALPAGKEWNSIQVTDGMFLRDIQRGQLERALPQMPISWMGTKKENLVHSDAPDYARAYPENIYSFSRQYLHGVEILIVNVYPVIEKNHTEINIFSQVNLSIGYRNSSRTETKLFPHQMQEVRQFVDNSEVLANYKAREEQKPGMDYLILATPKVMAYAGVNSLTDLLKGLANRGLNAKVVSLTTVDAFTGADRIEKIRNYIREEYKSNGIQYVLMVGRSVKSDTEPYFPARPLWSKIKAYFGYWTTVEESVPADAYYSFLDGTFNANNNDKWAEPNDGDNGGDVDFLPEVTVGRVVVDNDTQLQNFVRKTLFTYTNKLAEETALLGEELFPELNLYGDDYMNQLVGECTDHAYKTTGYSANWKLTKFYDKESSWTGSQAQSAISNSQISMVNHLGHSNNSTNMKLSSSNIPNFKNAKPFVFYTQGCLAGKYTVGSFVDKMVTATNAAVAAIGNSSYGLAPEDPQPETTKTPGGSQMLHRQFIHGLSTVGIKSLGKAHQASKVAFIGLKDAQEIRWVNWTSHYFGDPSLELNF